MNKMNRAIILICTFILAINLQAKEENSINHKPSITGKITDMNGVALEGAEITAYSDYMGGNLNRVINISTLSDENGYFNLPVDFDDLKYKVTFRYRYNNNTTMELIPAETGPLEIQLEIITKHIVRGIVINASDSRPVQGAIVKYFGEYQKFVLETKTDNKGQYEFTQLPLSEYQGVIYAQLNDKVSPAVMVRYQNYDPPSEFELKLDYGAELSGQIKTESKNKPIPNCTVSIAPPYACGYSLQTTTDANGRYNFINVPPADYKVIAENEDYFTYVQSPVFIGNSTKLVSGQKAQKDIEVKKRMRFEGKVVDQNGKPVEGAVLAIVESLSSHVNNSPFVARTDKKGNFSITTGRIDTSPKPELKGLDALKQLIKDAFAKRPTGDDAIEVFSSTGGFARYTFAPYREGDIVKGVKIKLNGTIRIHGKVTDTNGKPLKDITAFDLSGFNLKAKTNENGEYDFGNIPIRWPEKNQSAICFLAPRPEARALYSIQGENIPIEEIESYRNETGFFHHDQKAYTIEPGKEYEIDATLEPTDIITLSGKVSDVSATELKNVQLVLYKGNPDPNEWYRTFEPTGSIIIIPRDQAIMIQELVVDKDGSWKICIARENDTDIITSLQTDSYLFNLNLNTFSIGVYKNRDEHTLIQNIIINPDETEKEINIILNSGD